MPNEIRDEVRLGRNFVRKGDIIKVKLPGKTTFASGFKFVAYDATLDKAIVREPRRGHEKYVALDGIKRVAVTRDGQRIER